MIRKLTLTTIVAAAFVAVTLTSGNIVFAGGVDNGIASERGDSVSPLAAVTTDGLWHEFLFGGAGSFATACAGSCVPSSGGNSVDAGAPPWTFMCTATCDVTVSDAFSQGDVFELFDFGVSQGLTSAVAVAGNCGSDPAICVPNPASSSGVFLVGPGPHSLTIGVPVSPFGGGAAYFNVVQILITADVDIKPGSDPNSINIKSMGVVPVAILGSATLDVTDIDVTTLSFEGESPTPKHDLTDPLVYADHLEDVNLDGFIDLVSHYVQKDISTCGNTSAEITANLFDGTALSGSDSVRLLHC